MSDEIVVVIEEVPQPVVVLDHQGPPGPAGPPGADGVDGTDGLDGAPGDSHVPTAVGVPDGKMLAAASDAWTIVDAPSGGGGVSSWNDLTDKPTEFPPEDHAHEQSEIAGLTEALAAKADSADLDSYALRAGVLVQDDFARYNDGPLSGETPNTGGDWVTTGAEAPTIVDGALSTVSDAGYAFQYLDAAPTYLEALVSFINAPSASMTMAWAGSLGSELDDLLHVTFQHDGYEIQLRNGGGSFDTVLFGAWTRPVANDGTERATVAVWVAGDTLVLCGPNGETLSVSNPRIRVLAQSPNVFWEPTQGHDNAGALLHAVKALRVERQDANHEPSVLDVASASLALVGSQSQAVGNRDSWWQVQIGRDPATGMGSLRFGPDKIITRLTADATAGATTITTLEPLYAGSVTLVHGSTSETVTVTGNPSPLPGGGVEYTATLTAPLAHSYPAFDTGVQGPGFTWRSSIQFNAFAGIGLEITTAVNIAGNIYLSGTQLNAGHIGLGNVDNTSDASKPVSTAQQTALDGKANTSHSHTLANISDAGTAAALNVPTSGNATSGQVVKGNDTRLSDSRTPTTHSHVVGDVTGLDEQIRDVIGTALVAGSNVTITVNDAGDTITIAATGGSSTDPTPDLFMMMGA